MIWDLAGNGERVALVDGETGESLTYKQLADLSNEAGSAIQPRSLVFSFCTNSVGSIAGYLGFLNAGVVPLLLDVAIDRGLLKSLADVYKPEYYWLPESMAQEFPHLELIVETAGYCLLATGFGVKPVLNPDLAVLVSTSGSTGTPKLVRLSYQNIRSNTESIVEYLHIGPDERAITSLPMNYVYGLSVLQTHISVGAALVLTDLNCYAGKFWKIFTARECTSFAGVPFMYEMLDKLKFTKAHRYTTLKTMTQAGGRLSPELQDKFASFAKENGIAFVVMYGASEATARMSYLPSSRALDKRGSIGIAIPGGRFEIADEQGNPVAEGSTGELVYYGQNVSLGYAECVEDLACGDDNAGRLKTGDLAFCDEDGYYYVVGRLKRFIKILGKRTSLAEVEEILKSHFEIVDVACGGKDDLLRVYLGADAGDLSAQTETVSAFVHETLGINQKMIEVHVVDAIPKNASGKTLYAELEKLGESD